MKHTLLSLSLFSLMASSPLMAQNSTAHLDEARSLAQQFGGQLQPTLGQAMKQGGPVLAVEVCHSQAPAIAQKLAEASGWEVNRVSLKPRGAQATPDAWEVNVLTQFNTENAAGKDPKTLEFSEITTENGLETFRYMKAIPTGGVCLSCHGGVLAAPVKAAIAAYYPEDLATGYSQGEVRGAFSFSKTLYPAMGTTTFVDQWERPIALDSATQWVVFSKSKDGGNWVRDAFNAHQLTDPSAKGLVYIADISGMPALISKWFAIPKMQNYAFPMALVKEEALSAHWPFEADSVMVYRMKNGQIVKATALKDAQSVAQFVAGLN